jgi:Lon-like ATP-dependent protease
MNWLRKIYRKAALRLVQDLGEEIFPEPATASTSPASDSTSETKSIESQEPQSNDPSTTPSSVDSATTPPAADTVGKKVVTTIERKPLVVPATVHVRITPETLKDYVGPPVYQKDRMYVNAPPAGVSTGLGYLGNGSGAVMPVEAMVCLL